MHWCTQQKHHITTMLDCYIINLDRAQDRWKTNSEKFRPLGLNVIRMPAIEGKDLTFPRPDFAPWRFFFYYGRKMVPNKVACFLTHIKILKTFLTTDKEHVMICEDDVYPLPELVDVLKDAMRYSKSWDFLRLNGIKPTKGIDVAVLPHGFHLRCDVKTASGTGAYVVNRYAAETIIRKCLPVRLPTDLTYFRDWPIGIREMTIHPFPIPLNETASNDSTIGKEYRYPIVHPASLRHIISLPYRICSRSTRRFTRICWAMQNYILPPQPYSVKTNTNVEVTQH